MSMHPNIRNPPLRGFLFCLPGEAGQTRPPEEGEVTPTEGRTMLNGRASTGQTVGLKKP